MTAEPVVDRSTMSGSGRWPLVILILLAFALRIYDLGGQEFWFDEALSANISGLGWEGTMAHLQSEPFEHPPLYYLSLYPWQQLAGTSEFAFRLYSVFWGVLFVPLLYILVGRLTTRHRERLGWLAALLAACSPFLVAYSQEARMYTLLPCLALLVLLSFWNALQRERQPGWWLAYMTLMAIGVATHYYFALIWVATTVHLVLEFPRHRRARGWGIAAQVLLLLIGAIWLFVAPGVRDSLARVWQGETAFSLTYKLGKVMPTLMLSEAGGKQVGLVAHILAAMGWMLVLVGVWWSRRSQVLTSEAWRLLMLFLVVPLAASFLIPYGVLGRHLGYTQAAILAFVSLGLVALGRKGWLWLAGGILTVLLSVTYGLVGHYTFSNGSLGRAMAYIDARGETGDLLLLTQPAQQPLVEYYNDEGWPVCYLPPTTTPLTPAEVADALLAISQNRSRLWLGPMGAWTADPELLVEQWLVAHAFQAEKVWFPDSHSVALYFSSEEGLTDVDSERHVWGGRIRLLNLSTSPLQITVGDALRLRFDWQARIDLDERYVVRLSLVDDQGLTWAERRSEPCGGWCPTDRWKTGDDQRDQHALLIPPGTPPGIYRLQVAWLPLAGGPALQGPENGERAGQITVAQVTVLRPQGGPVEPWELPNPLHATFGGEVTLLGYGPSEVEARPGEMLHLDTHWLAETAPASDYTLVAELVDRRGQVAVDWESAPSAGFYPTSMWQPGETLRGQHHLLLPSSLSPGRYRLRIALVSADGERLALTGKAPRQAMGGLVTWQGRLQGQDLTLASIRLLDRPRQFKLPAMSQSLEATVGRQAHLVGYDLDLSQAHPGGQVHLTLYWQAGGPMVRPFKVFTHLIDDQDKVQAQHDAPPGGGCCPTNTWIEGEVIVDEHPIHLGVDLLPGGYQLVVGMYDEDTPSRLPAYDAGGNQLAHDRVQISAVAVEPASATGEEGAVLTRPWFGFDHVIYIPLLQKGKP